MTDTTAQPQAEPAGLDLYIEAAWTHARSFMAERGFVPDVMVLARYADEELMFVFPSNQDRDTFLMACVAETAAFGADLAMLVGESELTRAATESEPAQTSSIVKVLFRERGGVTRAQIADLKRLEGQPPVIGPVMSMPGEHAERLLDSVFGNPLH